MRATIALLAAFFACAATARAHADELDPIASEAGYCLAYYDHELDLAKSIVGGFSIMVKELDNKKAADQQIGDSDQEKQLKTGIKMAARDVIRLMNMHGDADAYLTAHGLLKDGLYASALDHVRIEGQSDLKQCQAIRKSKNVAACAQACQADKATLVKCTDACFAAGAPECEKQMHCMKAPYLVTKHEPLTEK